MSMMELTPSEMYDRLMGVERQSESASQMVSTVYSHMTSLESKVKELSARLDDYVRMFGHLQTIVTRLQSEDIARKEEWMAFLILLSKQEPEVMEDVRQLATVQVSTPKYADKGV